MAIAVEVHRIRETTAAESLPCGRSLGKIAVFDDLQDVEPLWRRLERDDAWATPYQRFDLLASWQRHVGARKGVVPFIVVGLDASDEPSFLWPFGSKRVGPLRLVRFLGSKHASLNLGLWRRDVVATISTSEIEEVLTRLPTDGQTVDLLALTSQPLSWAGIANPFAALPRQRSVDENVRLTLAQPAHRDGPDDAEPALSASMRLRLNRKERRLGKLPGYRYVQASTPADIDRLLDRFFALKAVHMSAQGLANVFAEPGVATFLRQACHIKLADGRPLIEIHALETDAEMLAVFGAVVDRYRFSSMFNTYTLGDSARHSPGLVLLRRMVADCARRGVRTFDLGVGRAQYKSFFCREPEPLFDTFLPLTARGRILAVGFAGAFAAKRMVKAKPALWAAVQLVRSLRASS